MFVESGSNQPEIISLADFEPGQMADCFALLSEKNAAQTRDGKPYFRVVFRDARREVTSMIWSDTAWFEDCDQNWQVGAFYKLRCRYFENQYGPQIDIDKVRLVNDDDQTAGFNPDVFYPASRFDRAEMFAELLAICEEHISEIPLRQLVVRLLEDHAEELQSMSAAARNHHAFIGGYLEHVLSVTKTGIYLADKYREYYPDMQSPLSKSLVVAGTILHDIGKQTELRHDPAGASYTPEGRLIGHILLGRDIVRDKAREIEELDAETLLRLEHIIVSHQNLPEWGSPVAPHTPEALLVHYADDIDAKFQMMAAALMADDSDEPFTSRQNPLRRQIFRGLSES